MARIDLKPGTLEAPLPAVLVTVSDGERDNIMTAAWTGILSSDPARAYVSVRPSRYTHDILEKSGEFVIHLTSEKLAFATDYCGIYTGAKVDKFEKLRLTKVKSKCVTAPTVAESPIALECKVFQILRSGTHDIYLADIVNVSCDESLLDGQGRLRLDKAGLIAYSHGEYYALGRVLGRFGFSTAKQGKKKPGQTSSAGKSTPSKTAAPADRKIFEKPTDKTVKKPYRKPSNKGGKTHEKK